MVQMRIKERGFMKKDKVLGNLGQAWLAFVNSYSGLKREKLLTPGVTGEWSIKEIVSHVSWWEEEALKHLPVILNGGRPKRYSVLYGGIDAFNARMAEERRALTLEQALKWQDDTHRRLIEYLQIVPEQHFIIETRFRRRLRLDTYGHYRIHTQAILDWRQRQERE